MNVTELFCSRPQHRSALIGKVAPTGLDEPNGAFGGHSPQRNKQRQRRRNENNRHLELRREQHPDRHLSVRIEALRVTTSAVGAIIGVV